MRAVDALEIAKDFRGLFNPGTFAKWRFAGSIRRGRSNVKDIEHVIIPVFRDRLDMLGQVEGRVNLLWEQLDAMVESSRVDKALYRRKDSPKLTFRWGEKYRGVDYQGIKHELFLASPENWGVIFGIRTGSALFSQHVVTEMLRGGVYRVQGGNLTLQKDGSIVPCASEQDWFAAARMEWLKPSQREV